MIVSPQDHPTALVQAQTALAQGQLLGLPTETVYGLAADALRDEAVAQIFAAKGRPADHPLIVHVASPAQVRLFASEVPAFAQRLMDAFWPGPLTLILPRLPGVANACAGGHPTIGLRCPAHPLAQALLQACAAAGMPGLAAPSANRFGRVSPTCASHVRNELGEALLILDGGDCEVGIESTIVDCSRGTPVLLRPGQVTRSQIETLLGQPLQDPTRLSQAAPQAPGTLASHYAPRAAVRLLSTERLHQALKERENLPTSQAVQTLQTPTPQTPQTPQTPKTVAPHTAKLGVWSGQAPTSSGAGLLWRQQAPQAAQAAHDLFAVLRELDAQGVQEIWVELPPDTPEWEGVRDRLQRAAAAG